VTLLEPGAAILAASLAVPALLMLYMLKLRRRPVRVSTAMFWVSAAKDLEANVPLRWLRASWLLVMQLLAVIALSIALGRPTIPSADASVDRLVLILDRSASTRAKVGDSTAFEELRVALLDRIIAIDRAGFSGEASLIVLDATPGLAAGPTRDLRELRTALQEIEPTDQPADLASAMRLATTIAAGPERAQNRESVTEQGTIELATDSLMYGELLPAGVRVIRRGLDEPSGNAGIVAMAARRDIDRPALIRVLVSIACEQDEPITLPIEFTIDNGTPLTRALRLEPDADHPNIQRGTLTEAMQLPQGGLIVARIIRPDVLESDNAAGVRIAPPPAPNIVLVQPTRQDLESDAGWIMVETLRALRPASLVQLTADEFDEQGVPEGTDLLILDGVAPTTTPANELVVPTLSFGIDPRFETLGVESTQATTDRFLTWERGHPLWRGAAIDGIRWRNTLRFTVKSGQAETLATAGRGPVAVLDETQGLRRIALSFRPADSTWPTHYSFALFLINAAEFLTMSATANAGLVLTTGKPGTVWPIDLGMPATDTLMTLAFADGPVRMLTRATDGSWSIGLLGHAGRYTLATDSERTIELFVSVLDESETLLSRGRANQDGAGEPSEVSSSSTEQTRQERRDALKNSSREVWYWFVIPAALLLAVEWFIYARRARI